MSIILQIWDNVISLQVLTKTKHYKGISRFMPTPTPRPQNVTANSNLTCKNSLKQKKTNKILPTAMEKIKFCFFKKTVSCSFRL